MSCIVYGAISKWVFQYMERVADQLRGGLSLLRGNIGVWSTLCVPNVKNPFWEIGITNEKVWLTAKPIITNSLATYAMFVIKSFKGMCSQHSIKLVVSITLLVLPVTKK